MKQKVLDQYLYLTQYILLVRERYENLQTKTLNHSNLTSMSRDMRLCRYLASILDLCKLRGFPMGIEFQQINTCYYTPLQTHW